MARYSMDKWQREFWRDASNLPVQVMGICVIGIAVYILRAYYLLPLVNLKHPL